MGDGDSPASFGRIEVTTRSRFSAALFALGLACAGTAVAGEKLNRQDLGRSVKLTILVDKVMLPEEKWFAKEWMLQAAAEAGFNVFCPRSGFERMDEVRQVAQWCAKHGIFHMPWLRGSLAAPRSAKAQSKRMTWANGADQDLWSPNADEFWDWTRKYVLEYAKISVESPHLIGVFLDYENYAKGKQGNLYPLSYDAEILDKFAKAKGIQLPSLEPAQRKDWLDQQGLAEQFSEFQIGHWRQRCRELRQAVDAINPTFQFCIYPAPGTLFMVQAVYPEWSTQRAPLILSDASPYGRPGRMITEQDALSEAKITHVGPIYRVVRPRAKDDGALKAALKLVRCGFQALSILRRSRRMYTSTTLEATTWS